MLRFLAVSLKFGTETNYKFFIRVFTTKSEMKREFWMFSSGMKISTELMIRKSTNVFGREIIKKYFFLLLEMDLLSFFYTYEFFQNFFKAEWLRNSFTWSNVVSWYEIVSIQNLWLLVKWNKNKSDCKKVLKKFIWIVKKLTNSFQIEKIIS